MFTIKMKPIIGIVGSFDWEADALTINDAYVKRTRDAGGIPVATPSLRNNRQKNKGECNNY